jgi:hypothetical protein
LSSRHHHRSREDFLRRAAQRDYRPVFGSQNYQLTFSDKQERDFSTLGEVVEQTPVRAAEKSPRESDRGLPVTERLFGLRYQCAGIAGRSVIRQLSANAAPRTLWPTGSVVVARGELDTTARVARPMPKVRCMNF